MQDMLREQQVQLAVQRIVGNPNIKFLIILDHGEPGVEFIPSDKSFVWLQGVLATTAKMVDEKLRGLLRMALSDENQAAHHQAAVAMVNKDEVKN
jgi:hypothetical protein